MEEALTRSITTILRELADAGFDLYGVASPQGLSADMLPDARSVVVVASGGGRLFSKVVPWFQGRSEPCEHPVDTYLEEVMQRVDPHPGPDRRWLLCHKEERLDFRTLGLRAGLGHSSRLGLLLHPHDGPWVGLRAACFTTEALPVTKLVHQESPCVGCPAPCASACPAGALEGVLLDIDVCVRWRGLYDTCERSCHARSACIVGQPSAYSALQHRYHNAWEGRPKLLDLLVERESLNTATDD
jgi:ferredoxin